MLVIIMPKSDKFLVLDLDMTLIRSFEPKDEDKRPKRDCDFRIGNLQVYKRPGLDAFLNYSRENFTLGVWSHGTGLYVDDVVEAIFKKGDLEFQWCYDECDFLPGDYRAYIDPATRNIKLIKDINVLSRKKCIPLSKIIVVDDQPLHYLDYKNLISVKDWNGEEDSELSIVQKFLSCIINSEDVREQIMHYRTYKDFCFKVRSA